RLDAEHAWAIFRASPFRRRAILAADNWQGTETRTSGFWRAQVERQKHAAQTLAQNHHADRIESADARRPGWRNPGHLAPVPVSPGGPDHQRGGDPFRQLRD